MTDHQPTAGSDHLDGYAEAMEAAGTPLLGYLVLYSVYDGQVTHADLAQWFSDLGLPPTHLPAPLRDVDAYERVTGASGVRVSYNLDDPAAGRPRGRRRAASARIAEVMPRHVRRDGGGIVRHIVREVRDEGTTRLSYDPYMGEVVFVRATTMGAAEGAGAMSVAPADDAIAALPEAERTQVREMFARIQDEYDRHRLYLKADRLRAVVRNYIESLSAIRVRPSGGVYFVHADRAGELPALRELVSRFGDGSHLSRVPLPNLPEMREMVIDAFVSRAADDLARLGRDIAAATADGATDAAIRALHGRYRALKAATTEHADRLSTSLDDTAAALTLVQIQLTGLLTKAGSDEDEDEQDQPEQDPTTT